MKTKTFIGVIVLTLVLLFAIPIKLRDGGSTEYKALLYQIKDVRMPNSDISSKQEFIEGKIIKILGIEVFNNVDKFKNKDKLIYGLASAPNNNDSEYAVKNTKKKTLEVMENTVLGVGKATFVELSDEDANVLSQIINNIIWNECTSDCSNDCVINLKGNIISYHAECGTLNKYNLAEMSPFSSKAQEANGKSFVLTNEDRITVNTILKKYIKLSSDNDVEENR